MAADASHWSALALLGGKLARWEREDIIGTQPAWLRATQGEKT